MPVNGADFAVKGENATLGEKNPNQVLGSVDFMIDGYSVTLTAEIGTLTPKEIWDTKDKWHKFVQTSKGIWEQMNEERREGVVLVVKDGIERLYDKVDEWIPEALQIESGNYIDVHFKILFTDVDAEVIRHQQATTFRMREAATEAQEMLSDL